MIKVSFLILRKPGLTLAEFNNYWREHHGPLFKSQPEVKQYIRRYIQVHSTGESLGQFPTAPYDGIVEVWFDKMEDIPAVFESENYKNNIAPDEARFIDRQHILVMYATEDIFIA